MRWTIALVAILGLSADSALADYLVAQRTIRARTVLMENDLGVQGGTVLGALSSIGEAIGKEARVTIYPGRPILNGDLVSAAIVERNQIIPLVFDNGLLKITAEGRALDRGRAGDLIRVMNLGSRSTVFALIQADGAGYVAN